MKSNISLKLKKINIVLFYFYIISYLTIFIFFEKYKAIFDIRYYVLAFCTMFAMLTVYLINGKIFNINSKKNIKYILYTGLLFFLVSIYKAHAAGTFFNIRSIVQISLFVLPLLYIYFLYCIFDRDEFYKIMKKSTIIFVIFYLMEPNHNIFSFFDIDNWKNVNFLSSTSFTESHICSESFFQLFLYFFYIKYYDTKVKQKKDCNLYFTLSLIFSILSFKRLVIAFIFLIFISDKFINYSRELKKNYSFIVSIIFTIATILYIGLLTNKISIGINMNKFSTNRDWFLSLWAETNYYSYGYGTSLLVIGRYLEMDLVQIYFELGVISLGLFCYSITKLAGTKLYTYFIVLYVMLNLLTSSTMPWTSGWIFLGINLMILSEETEEKYTKRKIGVKLKLKNNS